MIRLSFWILVGLSALFSVNAFDRTFESRSLTLYRPSSNLTPFRVNPFTNSDGIVVVNEEDKATLYDKNVFNSFCFARHSLKNIYKNSTVWSLAPNTVLPPELSVVHFDETGSRCSEYLSDLSVIIPCTPMKIDDYCSKVCSLPWTKLDGTPGLGELVSTQPHFEPYKNFSYYYVRLDALSHYIKKLERNLDSEPEAFDSIIYANKWRNVFHRLSPLQDSHNFTDCQFDWKYSERIVTIFTEVFDDWCEDDNINGNDAYMLWREIQNYN